MTPRRGAALRAFFYLLSHDPVPLIKGKLMLMGHSMPNPIYWFKNLAVFWMALPILADARRQGVTHLHANFGSSPATIAWLGKRMFNMGMSVTFHAFDIYSKAITHLDPLRKQKLRDANLVVAVHEHGRETLRRMVPDVPDDKFKVIRICVAFDPEQKPVAVPEPPLFLAAGNLVPKKGFDVLVRAVGQLKRRGVPARVRILGEGPERARLDKLMREEGVRDRVELPGYFQHQALAAHLAEALAFVMPSKVTSEGQRDGFPTVVVEAWLARTPVIASLVGGMAELIVHDRTGLVFKPDDAEGLADCMERLIGAPELRGTLATEGLRMARELFSSQRNVLSLLQEIREHPTPV
jgi:glycosyltransferase involved in cell wall biosynthesis